MPGKVSICLSILTLVWSGPALADCPLVWKPADQMSATNGAAPPASAIFAFAHYQNDLIAARETSLTRWDGTGWQELVTWDSGHINELLEYGGELIAGGDFTTQDGTHYYIARWNGQDWLPLDGGTDGAVTALVEYHGALIAAGSFLNAGAQPCKHIARWDGNAWHPLAEGLDPEIRDLIVFNDKLYAAGAGGIHEWDGSAWTLSTDRAMDCLGIYQEQLMAGGPDGLYFRASDQTWQPHPAWGSGRVSLLAIYNDCLLAVANGGGGAPPTYVNRWKGQPWTTIGTADAGVRALAIHHDQLFVGGEFTAMEGMAVNYCARYGPPTLDITQGLQPLAVPAGHVATLSVTATSDSGDVSYLWRKGGQSIPIGTCQGRASGCTSNTLTLDPVLPQDEGTWDVVVSSDGCSLTANPVRLIVLPDPDPPTVAITHPVSDAQYRTWSLSIDLWGTATDKVGVALVTWTNDRGGSGVCMGTANWFAGDIPLEAGANLITITARDAAGNESSATLTVTRECVRWYADADGDGYGDASNWVEACVPPAGYVLNSTDPNDADATVYPGAAPPDTDGDGVPDDMDQCPGTPAGTEVNAQGCPLSQEEPPLANDRDGDGMADEADGCPDDPDKVEPGSCGCGQPDTPRCSQPAPRGLCGAGMAGATAWSMVVMGLGLIRRKGWAS